MPDTASLYDRDFFAWTQDQAARLRAWPEHLRPNGIDFENLVEEVESLGKSDRRAIESFLGLIASHLLKIEFHPAGEARRHWRSEVAAYRTSLQRLYRDSPSLRAQRQGMFAEAWADALADLRLELADLPDQAALSALPHPDVPPRYDVDSQVLERGWYPVPPAG